MIEIPIGKALVAKKKRKNKCDNCFFNSACRDYSDYIHGSLAACCAHERVDGKDVIFKLVDYPKEGT